jgi:hypothetical protein
MAISLGRAEKHTADWGKKLAKFGTRASWPNYLFHTCQLEVAAAIIQDGILKSRNDVPCLICDVANQGAVWNNPEANEHARLYFRPKNWFHLKTEGIKSSTDPYRVDPHMSIPIAFAFDFAKVMTLDESAFLYGNFARADATPLHGDKAFDTLDFDLIYHDGPLPAAAVGDINNKRMSEVVVKGGLDLAHLSRVVCRTQHELRTLEHLLNEAGVESPELLVEQRRSVFMRMGIFLDELYAEEGDLLFKFHAPIKSPRPKYDLKITKENQAWVREYSLEPDKRWRIRSAGADAETVWRIEIEGCAAYLGTLPGEGAEGVV